MNKECIVGFSLLVKLPFTLSALALLLAHIKIFITGSGRFNSESIFVWFIMIVFLIFFYGIKTILTPKGWQMALILGRKRIGFHFHEWEKHRSGLALHYPDWGIHIKDGPFAQLSWGLTSNYKNGALYVLEYANRDLMEPALLKYLKRLKKPNEFKKKVPQKRLTKNQIKKEKKSSL